MNWSWNEGESQLESPPIQLGRGRRTIAFLLSLVAGGLRLLAVGRKRRGGVVVLEPFGLGDAVSLIPLLRHLLDQSTAVVCAVQAPWHSVLTTAIPDLSLIETKVPWVSYGTGSKYSMGRYLSIGFFRWLLAFRLKSVGRIGLDTRGDLRSCILLYLAGCSSVVTRRNYIGFNLAISAWVGNRIESSDWAPRWRINMEAAEAVSGLRLSSSQLTRFPAIPAFTTEASRLIGLIPAAPWPGKEWPSENWRCLVQRLLLEGYEIAVWCGPGQRDTCAAIFANEAAVLELDSVMGWISALSRCCAIVSLDSGPMHLADAMDIPVVGLFGVGSVPLWAPSGKASIVVHHQNDVGFKAVHPIWQNIDIGKEWMRRITVDEVITALWTVLKQGKAMSR